MDKNSPRNKALSYDPDFELIKLFASRHEEKHDIEQFFWNIFEDDDVIACVQAFFGYCFTGKTDLKIFGELVNPRLEPCLDRRLISPGPCSCWIRLPGSSPMKFVGRDLIQSRSGLDPPASVPRSTLGSGDPSAFGINE